MSLFLEVQQWINNSTQMFYNINEKQCKRNNWKCCRKSQIIHNNIPIYLTVSIQKFLLQKKTALGPQPPYIPHLSKADFLLFPKMEASLKGHWFEWKHEILQIVLDKPKYIQNHIWNAEKEWNFIKTTVLKEIMFN